MITITVENRDQFDLFVSITDMNEAGAPLIVDKRRINVDQAILVDIQEDGQDCGKIQWKAQRADNPLRTGQHSATPCAGDTVEVTTEFR